MGLQQPLPAKPWDTTPWKVEEERATWRRGSTAGTQTTLTVSPEWRRDTLASPTPWAAGAGRSLFGPMLPCSKAPAQLHFFDPTTTVVICSCRLAWKSPYASTHLLVRCWAWNPGGSFMLGKGSATEPGPQARHKHCDSD